MENGWANPASISPLCFLSHCGPSVLRCVSVALTLVAHFAVRAVDDVTTTTDDRLSPAAAVLATQQNY